MNPVARSRCSLYLNQLKEHIMTRITKDALVRINAALASDNEALRKQVADLELITSMQRTPTQRVARHMPQWQQDRAQAMAAARALAMSTGHVVRA